MIISRSSQRRLPVTGRVVEVEKRTPWYPAGTHNKLPLYSSSSIGEGELRATCMAIRGWKGGPSLGFKISRTSMTEHSNFVCTASRPEEGKHKMGTRPVCTGPRQGSQWPCRSKIVIQSVWHTGQIQTPLPE